MMKPIYVLLCVVISAAMIGRPQDDRSELDSLRAEIQDALLSPERLREVPRMLASFRLRALNDVGLSGVADGMHDAYHDALLLDTLRRAADLALRGKTVAALYFCDEELLNAYRSGGRSRRRYIQPLLALGDELGKDLSREAESRCTPECLFGSVGEHWVMEGVTIERNPQGGVRLACSRPGEGGLCRYDYKGTGWRDVCLRMRCRVRAGKCEAIPRWDGAAVDKASMVLDGTAEDGWVVRVCGKSVEIRLERGAVISTMTDATEYVGSFWLRLGAATVIDIAEMSACVTRPMATAWQK